MQYVMMHAMAPAFLLSLTSTLAAPDGPAVRAKYLIAVADDFIVEVYHNGRVVADSKRHLILDRFGATVERIDVEVRDGDWLVFNVVNNRLRWGGPYYFAVAGCYDTNEFGFESRLDTSDWSACDEPSQVDRFISEREYLKHRGALAVARPWHEGTGLMRQHAGESWSGTPVWGARKNTWIKVVVGDRERGAKAPRREEGRVSPVEGKPRWHVVVAGDTLYSLAERRYGWGGEWRRILAANPWLDPLRLQIGETVFLPDLDGDPGRTTRRL